jgi:AcrR family transcriptional regulator
MRPKIIGAEEIILKTGKEHLLSKGMKRFSTTEIARECGVATGTVYNYYGSKANLIKCIIENDWDKMLASLEENMSPEKTRYENTKYIYDGFKWFKNEYKFSELGLFGSEELFEYEKEDLKKLYDIVARKLESEKDADKVEFDVDAHKAAFIIVQLCMLAGGKGDISFPELWSIVHIKEK